MPECYIRGSTIKYLRIPDEIIDMVKEEVVSKGRGRGGMQQQKQQKGRGVGGAGRGNDPVPFSARGGAIGIPASPVSPPGHGRAAASRLSTRSCLSAGSRSRSPARSRRASASPLPASREETCQGCAFLVTGLGRSLIKRVSEFDCLCPSWLAAGRGRHQKFGGASLAKLGGETRPVRWETDTALTIAAKKRLFSRYNGTLVLLTC